MKSMRRMAGALALAAALAGAGCIKVEQNLTLRADGSGNYQLAYSMAEQTLSQLDSMRDLAKYLDVAAGKPAVTDPALANPLIFDEQELRDMIRRYRPYGVNLDTIKVEKRGGARSVDIKLSFKDLKGLSRVALLVDNGFSLVQTREGNYTLAQKINAGSDIPSFLDAGVDSGMSPVLTGLRVLTRINTPTRILNTNANRGGEKSAVWEVDFDKDPKTVARLRSDLSVTFEGRGLAFPEIARAAAANPKP